jgi:hypothetical protein
MRIIEAAPVPGIDREPLSSATQAAVTTWSQGTPAKSLRLAALWLLAGDLEQSHAISQSYETSDGAYWHGIMHRREGDFWNSKYWFRRVGQHPVLVALAQTTQDREAQLVAAELGSKLVNSGSSFADALVDACEAALNDKPEWRSDLETICWWEWQLLFQYSK